MISSIVLLEGLKPTMILVRFSTLTDFGSKPTKRKVSVALLGTLMLNLPSLSVLPTEEPLLRMVAPATASLLEVELSYTVPFTVMRC